LDVLFPDQPHRDIPSISVSDRHAEDRLEHEYALCMVAQGTVAGVRDDLLRLVEPLVEGQIVLGLAAPALHGAERVIIAVRHRL
jgi:hypothetical protein